MKVHMIDPPGGWKYGFPKAMPNPEPADFYGWLVSEGYPQKEIDSMGEHFYCRQWEEEIPETTRVGETKS